MHEMALAESVMRIVEETARKSAAAAVRALVSREGGGTRLALAGIWGIVAAAITLGRLSLAATCTGYQGVADAFGMKFVAPETFLG